MTDKSSAAPLLPLGAVPVAPDTVPSDQADRRVSCERFSIGWDRDEIRVEGFACADPEEPGYVTMTGADGAVLVIPSICAREVADALRSAGEDLWSEHCQRRRET